MTEGGPLVTGPTIALSMGERGLPARLLAPKYGAFLTFGALRAGKESAPGVAAMSLGCGATWRLAYDHDTICGPLACPEAQIEGSIARLQASAVLCRCRAAHSQPADDPVSPA
jgi:Type I 3-dehydroquinase